MARKLLQWRYDIPIGRVNARGDVVLDPLFITYLEDHRFRAGGTEALTNLELESGVTTAQAAAGAAAVSAADAAASADSANTAIAAHIGTGGAAHAAVTAGANGFMIASDKSKLDGIAAGATANQSDASLLDRANHTGTQDWSTLTGTPTTVAGYGITDAATLNGSSRVEQGTDATDDLIVDLATKGLVLKDTQGTPHYWRVTIDNTGVLVTTDLGTTKP